MCLSSSAINPFPRNTPPMLSSKRYIFEIKKFKNQKLEISKIQNVKFIFFSGPLWRGIFEIKKFKNWKFRKIKISKFRKFEIPNSYFSVFQEYGVIRAIISSCVFFFPNDMPGCFFFEITLQICCKPKNIYFPRKKNMISLFPEKIVIFETMSVSVKHFYLRVEYAFRANSRTFTNYHQEI